MALIIVIIALLGFLLIATEKVTNINKAAVAVFAGTLCWVLYICYGADFVSSQHSSEYTDFLSGAVPTSVAVKQFIASNIFLKYVGRAAEIVLYLLATMTIVEVLNNNGCFDFLKQLLRTRNSRKMLWMLALITFILSANLDNLTSTVMMLTMMHGVVQNRRQRMLLGSVIVISANMGGALTVIGDPTNLIIWNKNAVSATNYSLAVAMPCLMAWVLPTWWIGRALPERVDTGWIVMPYRGDDTRLNVWQRLLMLIVGIGGLWFIPTFHDITKLSPFLGAFCVLSILWIVNEIFNRRLDNVDKMIQNRIPRVLQYGVIQMMLFIVGIMLLLGVVKETGAISWLAAWCNANIHNVWIMGIIAGAVSSVLDNVATAASFFTLYDVSASVQSAAAGLAQNGIYWKVIAFSVVAGGNILAIGSMAGLSLLKMEHMHVGWFFRNVGWKALVGALAGLGTLYLTDWCYSVWV
ncbi:MAG: SLC13 family permease [Prevotella sp.]|jgi:Na+/H+ antiporter NhaD/arsenite permease-like protein|nr:SLC13 family permease [Prevotella sp.]